MPRSKEIALFGQKLDLLLAHDPVIRTRTRLASELGIDPSRISKWQSGGDYASRANHVPASHVEAIGALFGVGLDWLEAAPSVGEPEDALLARLGAMLQRQPQASELRGLVVTAIESSALQIHRLAPPPPKRRYRGLEYPYPSDAPFGVPFRPGDQAWIEIRADVPWRDSASSNDAGASVYLVLCSISSRRTQCLCPARSELAPEHIVRDRIVRVPVDAPSHSFTIDYDAGVHTLLAVLTRDPFGDTLYERLRDDEGPDPLLEQIALTLRERDRDRWTCLRRRYYVEAQPAADPYLPKDD
jgi:hypothetical protein